MQISSTLVAISVKLQFALLLAPNYLIINRNCCKTTLSSIATVVKLHYTESFVIISLVSNIYCNKLNLRSYRHRISLILIAVGGKLQNCVPAGAELVNIDHERL